jgi:AraC-like DNA-binding protein
MVASEDFISIHLDPLPVLVGAGECVVRAGWIHSKECQPHHKLLVCEQGVFDIIVDDDPISLQPGQYAIVPSGSLWEGTSPACEGDRFWWIIFDESGAKTLHSEVRLPIVGTLEDPKAAKSVFERLLWRIHQKTGSQLGLQLGVAEVIWELGRQASGSKKEKSAGNKGHMLAHEIILHLRAYLAEPMDVHRVAADCGLQPEYMRKVFKEATGRTLQQYVRWLRMEQAKRLLERGELRISEIALQVGYEDAGHFSKMFHKETGVWPSEFRFHQIVTQNPDGEFYPFVDRPDPLKPGRS